MSAIIPYGSDYRPNWTYWQPERNRVYCMDALTFAGTLPAESVNCVVTSPPYFGLRDYGVDGQIGLETTIDAYVGKLVALFREVKRILRDDGTLWLNLGDSYTTGQKGSGGASQKQLSNAGSRYKMNQRIQYDIPDKNLMGIPWRVALALQADGWILRNDVIWHKPSCMPESVTDRFTRSHEYIFLFAKSGRYAFDQDAVKEKASDNSHGGGRIGDHRKDAQMGRSQIGLMEAKITPFRNRRTVWTINPGSFPDAHFATFPHDIPEIAIKAGCPVGGLVYDPFMGSGTTALVARDLSRDFIGSDLNPDYVAMAERRLAKPYQTGLFEHAG